MDAVRTASNSQLNIELKEFPKDSLAARVYAIVRENLKGSGYIDLRDAGGQRVKAFYQNNLIHGTVKVTLSDSTFEGFFDSGYPIRGICRQRNKTYSGSYKEGLEHGYGEEQIEDEKYVGNFVGGKREGHGELTKADGLKYTGEFKGGKANGPGVLILNDRRKFKGNFVNGCLERGGRG